MDMNALKTQCFWTLSIKSCRLGREWRECLFFSMVKLDRFVSFLSMLPNLASWGLRGVLGGFLGPPGASWGFLGSPGAFWGFLGGLLGFLGLPGASWGAWGFLGLPGDSWGFLGGLLGLPGATFRPEARNAPKRSSGGFPGALCGLRPEMLQNGSLEASWGHFLAWGPKCFKSGTCLALTFAFIDRFC